MNEGGKKVFSNCLSSGANTFTLPPLSFFPHFFQLDNILKGFQILKKYF
jgi:hypothetical protein